MAEIPVHLQTIADYHRFMGLPQPAHPLLSVVRFEDIQRQPGNGQQSIIHYFYSVALKKDFNGKLRYGQQTFDFDGGVMHFMSPKQVLAYQHSSEETLKHTGWLLLIHPDFLWNTPLAKKIKHYEYFGYQMNEALHLSDKEEMLMTDCIEKIAQEYTTTLDRFSQDVMIAQIELVLTYCERFYQRQFITRKIANHALLEQLEALLRTYFSQHDLAEKGMPSVRYIADQLHVSTGYLSRLLQLLTGQSTKHFIQDKLIELAKEKLSTTCLSVNEIAYQLGFEHAQSFSKLFKNKTKSTPLAFRQSFN